MSPTDPKPHLRYESVEAWIAGEDIPVPFTDIRDPGERDRVFEQYAELRAALFDRHIQSLSPAEQAQFRDGEHPSQSHAFADRARPFARALQADLRRRDVACDVTVGFYQQDRIVLTVDLLDETEAAALPSFFSGFEVKYAGRA